MDCSKCKGLMMFESFVDFLGTTNCNFFGGWRCLSCGRILDPMIATHQKYGPSVRESKFRKKS